MGSITIGGRELAAARPDDLAARLLAGTGLGLDEAERLLVRSAAPALVARAIAPLLTGDDAPGAAELGQLVAGEDLAAIADQVAPFYRTEEKVEQHGEA